MKRALILFLVPVLCLACAGTSEILGNWVELATEELEALLEELSAACDGEGEIDLELLLADGADLEGIAVCAAVELIQGELDRRAGRRAAPSDAVKVYRDGDKVKIEKVGG